MNSCTQAYTNTLEKSFEFRGLLNQLTGSARELFKSSSAGWTVPKLHHGWSTFHVVFLSPAFHSTRRLDVEVGWCQNSRLGHSFAGDAEGS